MLAVVGALSQEVSDMRRLMAVEGVDTRAGFRVYRGKYRSKNLLLVQCGVGKQRAQSAMSYVLDHYPVTSLILVGFAGALKPGLKAGDLAACSALRCAERQMATVYRCDPSLLSAAQACEGLACQVGVGVTCLNVVTSEQAKKELGEAFSADVVDMESYWIARIAAKNHIPFITIRAVSDTVAESLPELPSWRWTSMLAYLAFHPAPVFRLYRNIKNARRNLTLIADHMIEVAA